MKRFAIGFLTGLVTMYFCDPEHGELRRRRFSEWWSRNRDDVQATVHDVVETSRQAAEAGQGLSRQVVHTTVIAGRRVREKLNR
jgi:DNA-binding transcriptional LysR family regulator